MSQTAGTTFRFCDAFAIVGESVIESSGSTSSASSGATARALVDAEVAADGVGMRLAEPLRAEAGADLLVGGRREDQVTRRLEPLAGERSDRDGAGRDLPLHVERAAAPDLAVAQFAA